MREYETERGHRKMDGENKSKAEKKKENVNMYQKTRVK